MLHHQYDQSVKFTNLGHEACDDGSRIAVMPRTPNLLGLGESWVVRTPIQESPH